MFHKIDPTILERLVAQGKLIKINGEGRELDTDDAGTGDGPTLNVIGPIAMPLQVGEREVIVSWYAATRLWAMEKVAEMAQSLREHRDQSLSAALSSGIPVTNVLIDRRFLTSQNPLVRVHSSCLTGDVFGSCRCDCGAQLQAALQRILEDPQGGMLIYMSGHEGRGIGIWAKALSYLLQDAGEDTYQANRTLGLPDDSRDYSDAAAVLLHFLGDRPIRLMTNNPKKVADLAALGLKNITVVRHVVGISDWNRHYLRAKRNWGHVLTEDDLA